MRRDHIELSVYPKTPREKRMGVGRKQEPVGMKVTAESELIAIDGRKLTFKVTAFDEVGKIGEGIHERFIINNEKFQAKTNSKK